MFGDHVFESCNMLERISFCFSSLFEMVGGYAFHDCPNLHEVFPSAVIPLQEQKRFQIVQDYLKSQ